MAQLRSSPEATKIEMAEMGVGVGAALSRPVDRTGGADAGAGEPKTRLVTARDSGVIDLATIVDGFKLTVDPEITVAGRTIELWNDEDFSKLREMHGVRDDFLEAINLEKELPKISKGNAPLFRTDDEEYIIKAMGSSDQISMLELTPHYCERLMCGSLLSPIYLHFRFAPQSQSQLLGAGGDMQEQLNWPSFIAMRNLTPNVGTYKGRYDLKGCDDDKTLENEGCRIEAVHKRWWHFWYCRCCWSPARWIYWQSKQDAKQFTVALPEEQREEILDLLRGDVEWLIKHGLMDYSLLVGVQRFRTDCDPTTPEAAGICAEDSGLLSMYQSVITFGAMPTGRQCWSFLDTVAERRIKVHVQSREELERGAVNRIMQSIEQHGLDPRDWEFYLQGVADDPRKSVTPNVKNARSVKAKKDNRGKFPRIMDVRLLKKNRDRPCSLITISIIDFLQQWTFKKKIAGYLKVCEANKATVPPDEYGERFIKYFSQCLEKGLYLQAELGVPETPPVVKPESSWAAGDSAKH